jgi:predicted amidohydrolase YtcJ
VPKAFVKAEPLVLADASIDGVPCDIRIDGGVIAHITPAGTVASPGIERIELDGRPVIPGLWDNHVHFSQWALRSRRLDISSARSAAETARLISDARLASVARSGSDAQPGPDVLVAVGFRDALWPDEPTLDILDGASSAPVVVVSGDLHAAWLNSSALALFGFAGHPSGLLREDEAFGVVQRLDSVPHTELDAYAAEAAHSAAARGVVGIVDYEMADNAENWMRRASGGSDALRVEFGIYADHLAAAIERRHSTGDRLHELVTVGNLKVLTDGSLNTRTAWCYDPYRESFGDGSLGVLTMQPDALVELMTMAATAGIRSSIHAIGDHANTIALDAFESLGRDRGFGRAGGVGDRIEHAQLLAPADLPRFARLAVAASVQPDHAMDDRDVADRLWRDRTDRAFPLRSLLDAGATLLLGSDAPVSPLDPWRTIAAAVGRSRDGRESWHPEQAISVSEAIEASSRSRIRVGEVADLAVLDREPWTASIDELRGMRVELTMLGGRVTHRAMV